MNTLDIVYQDLLQAILTSGVEKKDRTGRLHSKQLSITSKYQSTTKQLKPKSMKNQISLLYKFETLVVGTSTLLILLTEVVIHI
jgi:hypothetical protein